MKAMMTVGEGLSMDPSEASTQTGGILGGKGSGKTYLAGKVAEELFDAGCPVLIFDPVGNWGYGLRLASDGKSPGLPIAVIGGEHGDIPLDITRGAEIGKFLRDRDASAVIDVSEFSKRKRKEFVADFCEALFQTSRKRRTPYMVIFEEAHVFAPQRLERGEERMYGAVTDIVRLGRNYGLGSIMVTQRPQSVAKEVLNMVECLFVGSMRGPQERAAIKEWVSEQGLGDQVKDMLGELPKLEAGNFYVWSPSWLKVFKKVKVGKKRTFDGSSTPVLGKRKGPQTLAPIDLGELEILMKAEVVLEEAGASKGRKALPAALPVPGEMAARAEALARRIGEENRRLLQERDARAALLRAVRNDLSEAAGRIQRATEILEKMLNVVPSAQLEASADGADAAGFGHLAEGLRARARLAKTVPSASASASSVVITRHDDRLPDAPSAIATPDYMSQLLGVIVQHGPVTRHQLSILSGKSRTSSTFASALRTMVHAGMITDSRQDGIVATELGRSQSSAKPLPKGKALYDYWCSRLGEYDRVTFTTIVAGPKSGLTRADISSGTGHSQTSSTFAESIRTLRTLGLVEEVARRIRLSDTSRKLFGF